VDVPGRVSVVSFGDDEGLAEQATPALSTGYHPSRTMGQIAGHRLADVVEGLVPSAPQVVVVPVGFHVRESCGAVARGLAAFDSFQEVPFSGFVGRLAVPPTQRNRP
jgi:DNA-binding LacI/PurR family transcriptional regulator